LKANNIGMPAWQSRGRYYPEAEHYFSPFQLDRERLIHSTAFRRLEYKTQVFINHEGDHYRNRLTHSLEVASTARAVATSLNLNQDLTEIIALAHDLGHPPFGHTGEDSLEENLSEYGGFDHNIQALRILTKLEDKFSEFNGLNLTWETLEGIIKHKGPFTGEIPGPYEQFAAIYNIELKRPSCGEAQLAHLADDLTYHCHDIEDGLRANLLEIEQLKSLPLLDKVINEIDEESQNLDRRKYIHEIIRRLRGKMVGDIIEHNMEKISKYNLTSSEDFRNAKENIISFSPLMQEYNDQIKSFLMKRMYRHFKNIIIREKASRIINSLFEVYSKNTGCLPEQWRQKAEKSDTTQAIRMRVIGDYIAGMTDRYAIKQYEAFFSPNFKHF
jgi:dGTPase